MVEPALGDLDRAAVHQQVGGGNVPYVLQPDTRQPEALARPPSASHPLPAARAPCGPSPGNWRDAPLGYRAWKSESFALEGVMLTSPVPMSTLPITNLLSLKRSPSNITRLVLPENARW